ncbi:MAG TPA: protein kinase [Pyrinomonadaceae bacterium]|nr:protein kinase [Pyrinomonadaceae bacterium]
MKVCPVCGKEYSNTSTLCPVDGEVLQTTADPLIGETLAGKYLIEELIKSGGMGSVYRGKHILMDKRVAIKVLRPSLAMDDAVVARFSREAKAASRISHPHAVNVTDFGESENGVVFLVMEYLDGRTLKEIIKSEGAMPLARTVEIVRQVSGALDAAHEQGVIHRDLKSDNIMLSQTNGGEWAKVLDFGIAKIQQPEGALDMDITAANLVIGTPQYMSPEQCSHSGPIDARSDVYSLGIIVYEMLAGRVPFSGESPTVIMMKQVQDEPPSIFGFRPDLPAGIGSVVTRALAKQPADRFQSAGDLSRALNEVSQTEGDSVLVAAPATTPNAAVILPVDDVDEETVVTPKQPLDEVTVVQRRHGTPAAEYAVAAAPAPTGVNPWRILLPAAIALVAVFGVVFFLTRGSGQPQSPNANFGQPGLVPDPNSQPVQPLGTPTGESERNIQSLPSVTPTPRPNANANVGEQIPSTAVTGEFGSNSNRNTNQRESSTPKPSPKEEEPPPPKSTPTVRVVPKSTPSPD